MGCKQSTLRPEAAAAAKVTPVIRPAEVTKELVIVAPAAAAYVAPEAPAAKSEDIQTDAPLVQAAKTEEEHTTAAAAEIDVTSIAVAAEPAAAPVAEAAVTEAAATPVVNEAVVVNEAAAAPKPRIRRAKKEKAAQIKVATDAENVILQAVAQNDENVLVVASPTKQTGLSAASPNRSALAPRSTQQTIMVQSKPVTIVAKAEEKTEEKAAPAAKVSKRVAFAPAVAAKNKQQEAAKSNIKRQNAAKRAPTVKTVNTTNMRNDVYIQMQAAFERLLTDATHLNMHLATR